MEGLILPVRTTEFDIDGRTNTTAYFSDSTMTRTEAGGSVDSAVTVVNGNTGVELTPRAWQYSKMPLVTLIARALIDHFERTGEIDTSCLERPLLYGNEL